MCPSCYNIEWRKNHKEKFGTAKHRAWQCKATIKRRHKVKKLAVEYKGGKCSKCGYNKCLAALEFHHTDPSTKTDNKRHRGLNLNISWERIRQELDSTILVCANCHREIEESADSKQYNTY